MSVYVTVIL